MSVILEVSDLRVERGSTVILGGVNWALRRGQHWAILGLNGSGKTSLLKALTGYLSPTAGFLRLLGRRYGEADWRELRLRVGIVTSALQASIPAAEPALETVVSGRYAQLDLWAHPTPAELREARRWMRFGGIAPLADREWLFLSQGERQRVLIARALMSRPKLLILDEPCAGLDPVAREDFLEFLEALARRRGGPALVLVTHHVEDITPAFTHALVLRAGQVFAAGPKRGMLTSRVLSGAYGARVAVSAKSGRYRAEVLPRR